MIYSKTLNITKAITTLGVVLLFNILSGCYSLSGSSLDPNWKTIKISTFPNYASYQNPNYSQFFTYQLQDIFTQRTNLVLTNDEDAHLKIEGEITGYKQVPVAITADEVASKNRLTITVRVRYINTKDESKSFDKDFSSFEEFPGTQTLQQAEDALIETITDRITIEIFNAIAMDW